MFVIFSNLILLYSMDENKIICQTSGGDSRCQLLVHSIHFRLAVPSHPAFSVLFLEYKRVQKIVELFTLLVTFISFSFLQYIFNMCYSKWMICCIAESCLWKIMCQDCGRVGMLYFAEYKLLSFVDNLLA